MAITLKQTVKLFPEESKTDEQAVTFDPSDSWLVVSHCGNEISLSVENWHKLNEIVKKALKNGRYQEKKEATRNL